MVPSYQPLVLTDKLFTKSKNALISLNGSVMLMKQIMRDTLTTAKLAVIFLRQT